jgi:hypothetical protein
MARKAGPSLAVIYTARTHSKLPEARRRPVPPACVRSFYPHQLVSPTGHLLRRSADDEDASHAA